MTYIEKLLEAFPELGEGKVEWKALGEVGELVRGNGLPKTDFTETGVPAIHYGQIYTYYGAYTEETISFVSPETAKKLKKVNTGDVIITNTSENLEDVGKSVVYLGKQTAVTGGHATIFKPSNSIIGKFFVYYTQTAMFFKKKRKYAKGAKVIDVSAKDLSKITIPIPPLSVQQEIVRILDKFTQLTAELTAELTARKKQYAYYRDELLSFEEGEVEWKTLGEVAIEFGRGKSKHRPRNDSRLYGGDTPLIQTGDIRNASHRITEFTQTYSEFGLSQSKLWPKGTLCITIAANIAETTILGFDSCFPDSIIGFIANPKETTENYVEYLLTSLKTKLESESTGSAQSNIKLATFKKLRFPFPSLSEQSRIVGILDKFDTLCSSISEGLPKEIELRQKQYEYYREKLLNFE